MASVFLSYMREDVGTARALAALLERSGHSVWWDRHIKGGAQFASEIEAALTAADKVVVLWSAPAVRSRWVRDEAAVGGDSGRLVPVSIDGTEPPLGFRQFQTIDFSKWNHRSNAPQCKQLMEAIASPSSAFVVHSGKPRPASARPRALVAAAAVSLAGLAAGGWWWAGRGAASAPVVAIDTVDGTEKSRQIARELAVQLGNLHSASSDAFQLISGAGKADVRLEVAAEDTPNVLRRDLSVLSGTNGSILWSTSLEQPPAKARDLSQQMTVVSQRVLSCAVEALSARKDRIDAATLKLYLNGCSQLDRVYDLGDYQPELARQFEMVVAKAPHFEGAWAKLMTTELEWATGRTAVPGVAAKLRSQVAAVEKLGFNMGELYAARAALLPSNDFLGRFQLYDDGLKAHPDNALLYSLRSTQSKAVGRMHAAVFDAARSVRLDPLSLAMQNNYILSLAYAGQVDSAYAQLRKAQSMWPNGESLQRTRFALDLRFGDPKSALAAYRNAGVAQAYPAFETFLLARIDPAPANVERELATARADFAQRPTYLAGIVQALGQFGRKDEAIDVMLNYPPELIGTDADYLFRPAMRDVWRDPRSMAAAAHLKFLAYWKTSGKWPDFCFEPDLPYDCGKEAAKYRG